MSKIERFCIICDKDVAPEYQQGEDSFTNPPHGATAWQTSGNYGSALFDPIMEDLYLECFICDECLEKKANKVYRVNVNRRVNHDFKPFETKEPL